MNIKSLNGTKLLVRKFALRSFYLNLLMKNILEIMSYERFKMYDIQTLEKLLKKYILDQDIPKKVSPKPIFKVMPQKGHGFQQ